MTNLFLKDPVYVTIDDVKDSTDNVELKNEDDDTIKILITKAQNIIDGYIRTYGIKFDDTQELIFPINVEDVAVIPNEIQIATLYIVEQLYVNGNTIKSANDNGDIQQEKVGDRVITYKDKSYNNTAELLGIPREAKVLLDRYKKTFYTFTL